MSLPLTRICDLLFTSLKADTPECLFMAQIHTNCCYVLAVSDEVWVGGWDAWVALLMVCLVGLGPTDPSTVPCHQQLKRETEKKKQ